MSQSTRPLVKKKWKAEDMEDQSSKIFIITGANSGLGFEGTRQLVAKNAKVIMAVRDLVRGQEALDEIKQEEPKADLELMELNLSSLESVKKFTKQFRADHTQLHGLLNNAGVMQPPRMETEEGFELQIGVNHLAHFALTGLLLDELRSTPGSRIISQSSIVAARGRINFEDFHSVKEYSRTGAYGQSKLANLLFAFELDRKLNLHGIETVSSIAVHPGYTATNLQQNGPTLNGKTFYSRLYKFSNFFIAQNVSKGTLPMTYAATAPDVEGGDYIGPRGLAQIRGYPKRVKAPKHAYNEEEAQKLWKLSEQLTGVKYNFEA
ncbi:MAG: SDR family oxidoreductase [Candidatus Heimdallarchaeota archaeon]|nr:SDR family oxidoreductase [Candidatus Heimdallarchaeota archaeon]